MKKIGQKNGKSKRFSNTPWKREAEENDYEQLPKMNFNTIIRDNGNFIQLPRPLVEFMGNTNAVFLVGIIDLYNNLKRQKKVKKGQLFYNADYFQKMWGVSLYQQNKAIKELSKCHLLWEIDKTFRNQKVLKISFLGCCCILQLIYEIQSKVCLFSFFKKILKDKEFRGLIKRRLKGMESEWDEINFPQNGKFSYENFKNLILKNLRTESVYDLPPFIVPLYIRVSSVN